MLNLGIGLGLSGGAGGAGVVLGASEFYAPLTHSLVLTRGTGSATFTRATKAWEFGYAAAANSGADQVLIEVASGVARFGGARYDSGTWYNTYADGSAISGSTLLGYHAEGARTNNLLYSRDLTKFNYWITTGTGSEKCGNGTFDDATGWTLDANYSVSGGVLAYSAASGTNYASYGAIADYTPGKTYLVEFDYVYTSGNGPAFYIRGGTAAFSSATTSGHKQLVITCGSSAATALRLAMFSAGVWTIDNLTVKEAAIQVTTCTGLDNAANSASTLTAGAADATILQTLSLAAAARSFSAYVKRRTGTGNVYITRDGGTSWTDITSQINGTTWTRVKIENTSVLNPSVGFKIATSGDAIDVDVCQDEAGAMASSPIVTTTAAVTRNGDRLLYAKAGNLADAAGSALASWCIDSSETTYGSTSRNALVVDTSGRVLYGAAGGNVGNGGMYDGTSSVHSTGATARNNKNHVKNASKWSGVSMSVVNGSAAMATAAYDGTMGAGASIDVCGDASGNNQYGYIRNVYIWSTALTDAQLQQVTS